MLNFPIFNFILYNFLQAHIKNVAIFDCWSLEAHQTVHQLLTKHELYSQFISINQTDFLVDMEYSFFRHVHPSLGIFLDMSCDQAESMLNLSSRLRLYNQRYHWLIYDENGNEGDIERLFTHANLSVDADVTYALLNDTTADNSTYTLYDVYNNGRNLGGKLNITIDREIVCSVQNCRLTQFLSKLHLRHKYGNREVLPDITMRITTVVTHLPLTAPESELEKFLRSIDNPHIDSLPRFGFKLILLKKDYFKSNFYYNYTNAWSISETDGGMTGALRHEYAELCSTPLIGISPRLKYLSIITQTSIFHYICMFRTPLNSGIQGGGVFLKPFSTRVWIFFAIILAVSAVLLWNAFRLEHNRMTYYLEYIPSLLSTSLISFGSACTQGSPLIPSSVGGRLIFITLTLLTYIMYNYYTSIVVSSLLDSPIKSNIKTMGQLADSSLDVGLEPLPYTMVFLNTSKLADIRRFVKLKIESKSNPASVWIPVEEGVKRVRETPGYVYVFEASDGYHFVEKYYYPYEICDLNEVMFRPDKKMFTFVPKNSTYKEFIRLKDARMLETGSILRYRRYWVRERLNCFTSNIVISVGMQYAAPLFIMLMGAYVLVLLILCLEILWHKRQQRRKRQAIHEQ